MRTEYDVVRSLAKYVALGLGHDVREVAEEGTVSRPGALIEVATPEARGDGSSAQILELSVAYNIFIYPKKGDQPLESRRIASEAAQRLSEVIESGIDEGRQGLIPLYDYDGVPFDADSTTRRSQDFAKVLDLSILPKQSPDDENLFTVLGEVRLGYRRDRALPSNARTTQSLRVAFA